MGVLLHVVPSNSLNRSVKLEALTSKDSESDSNFTRASYYKLKHHGKLELYITVTYEIDTSKTSVHPAIESHDLAQLYTTMKAFQKAESAEHDKSEEGGYGGTAHAPPVLINQNDPRNPWAMTQNARRGACGAERRRNGVKKVDSLFLPHLCRAIAREPNHARQYHATGRRR